MQTNDTSLGSLGGRTSLGTSRLHVRDLSDAQWPPQEGELVILYTSPESKLRGFVGWVDHIEGVSRYVVRLLDSPESHLTLSADELISTGKSGNDLVTQYVQSDQALSQAISNERSFPDFELVKPLAKSRTQARVKSQPKSLTQALKALTAEQSTVLAQLVLAKLKETRNDREKKANVHPQAPRT
jgi:hypothetical protein